MKDQKTQQILLTVMIAVMVGAAAFFGGIKYQQSKQVTGIRQFAAGNGTAGGRPGQGGNQAFGRGGANGANGLRPIVGQILSQDDKSITVKLQDGSSKIVLLPDSATYSKTAVGAKTDLKIGDNVGVFGSTNPDGSVTAQTIQENPAFGLNRTAGATPSATPTTK